MCIQAGTDEVLALKSTPDNDRYKFDPTSESVDVAFRFRGCARYEETQLDIFA